MNTYSILLKITAKNRKIIGGFVLLAIFVILFIYIFPDQFQNLKAVRKQLRYQTSLIKSREDKITRLLSIREEYNDLMTEVKNTHNMFFTSEEAVYFPKSINELAERKTNNNLLLMQPQSEKDIGSSFIDNDRGFIYKKKVIRMIVEGGFRSIEDLIKRFDNYNKLLKIENITLGHGSQESKIRAQIDLSMYLLTEGETGVITRGGQSENL